MVYFRVKSLFSQAREGPKGGFAPKGYSDGKAIPGIVHAAPHRVAPGLM
jgi:hypothetical protein